MKQTIRTALILTIVTSIIALSACQSAQKNVKTSSAAASSSKIGAAAAEVSSSSAASSASSSVASSSAASSSAAGSSGSKTSASSSKAPTSSSKASSSSKAAATTPTQTAPQKTSSAAQNTTPAQTAPPATDSRYVPIPQSQEVKSDVLSGNQATLNINAFCVQIFVNDTNVNQIYAGDDIFATVTESNGTVVFSGMNGGVAKNIGTTNVATGLDTYNYNNRSWLKPATYTVNVYCKKGDHSLNQAANRPDSVQIANFSFSVWEQGFKS